MIRFGLLVISLSAFMSACGTREEPPPKNGSSGALEVITDAALQEKEAYQKRVESELNEFDARIDDLKAKAERLGPEARAALDKDIDELRTKREGAQKMLLDLKSARGKAWDEAKSKLDAAIDDLKRTYSRARRRSE
jgi:peptidoglycan hydrolase CwlO-like protein